MYLLTKGKYLNLFKIKPNGLNQIFTSFSFSMKNELSKENQNDFPYEYNKYNSPNIEFNKEKAKEIEKSFGKIIKRYDERSKINQEANKKNNNQEFNKLIHEYKYSNCDHILKEYFHKNKNDKTEE